MSATRPHVATLIPFHPGRVACKCLASPLDPRLVNVLDEGDVQEMAQWYEHVPARRWWSFLSLWALPLFVVPCVAMPLLQDRYPFVWVLWPALIAVIAVTSLIDGIVRVWHTKKHTPEVLAQLEHLNVDWRARRGCQLLLVSVEGGFRFAVELGARHRDVPLEETALRSGFGAHFSTGYSLVVEELCGADYAARQFASDVELLNSVRAPRFAGLLLFVNGLAPLLVVAFYFAFTLGLLGLAFPSAASVAMSPVAIVAMVTCALASMPLMSYFRRRQSTAFVREMSAAMSHLQQCRGSVSGDWRWLFADPQQMFERTQGLTQTARGVFRMMERLFGILDLCLHLGPRFTVLIVSAHRAARDQNTELETLL
jgi:hypothetical protein